MSVSAPMCKELGSCHYTTRKSWTDWKSMTSWTHGRTGVTGQTTMSKSGETEELKIPAKICPPRAEATGDMNLNSNSNELLEAECALAWEWGTPGATRVLPLGCHQVFILSNQENFPVALVGKGKSKHCEIPVTQGKDLHSALSHLGQEHFSYSTPG